MLFRSEAAALRADLMMNIKSPEVHNLGQITKGDMELMDPISAGDAMNLWNPGSQASISETIRIFTGMRQGLLDNTTPANPATATPMPSRQGISHTGGAAASPVTRGFRPANR